MPSPERSSVSLRIFGDDLIPEDITGLLGVEPTQARAKGDMTVSRTGQLRVARTGSWLLKAREREPEDLDGQIEEILSLMTDAPTIWRDITGKHEVDLFCGLFMCSWNDGVTISPQSLAALGARGIKMSLDIYESTEDDDD